MCLLQVNQNRADSSKAEVEEEEVVRERRRSTLGGVRGSATSTVTCDENTRALNRQEWLQCLVRISIMRYFIPRNTHTAWPRTLTLNATL